MMDGSRPPVIRLRGVRHNNLKNFDLDLPVGKLVVVTGPSGSGKSSLAFDTLFAEGQRRYVETFSPYARQFFDRMDKPQVDRIEGIPPAIAIEQRNAVRSTRSTVGTMTEICDYLKVAWPHLAQLYCKGCAQPVRREPPPVIWHALLEQGLGGREVVLTFTLPLSEKLALAESLELIARQGYRRLWVGGEILRIEEAGRHEAFSGRPAAITVVQDRVRLVAENRGRFAEACEQAYHYGKGRLAVQVTGAGGRAQALAFSAGFHCARCDLDYREPTPALFSFNHPLGACPACKGFGRIIGIDYGLAIPDRSKTLAGGAVRPWQTGMSAECQADLMKFCRASGIPTDVPFRDLPAATQKWVIEGDPDYGIDEEHQWPRAWYGVKGYFRWLETKSYKMHVRVLLSRYRAYTPCPECQGRRLQPEALLYRLAVRADGSEAAGLTLADFYALPVERAFELARRLAAGRAKPTGDPVALALAEVQARLGYLVEVGLGYLTLDRPTRTLSGGETERVNLTTCLGSRLVNTLFVLDEPSVGLHPRDTDRLVSILRRLRDAGNTVVVVEHEASVMRAADQILDLGPGSGEKGGQLIFQGPLPELLRHPDSLTGQYLSGRKGIETPVRRPVSTRFDSSEGLVGSRVGELREAMPPYRAAPGGVARSFSSRGLQPCVLQVSGADRNNLRNLTVRIPLERFVCLTGVSGSGKTTLVREVLVPALRARLQTGAIVAKASDRLDAETASDCEEGPPDAGEPAPCRLTGWEALADVVLVDQSPLGKTPRSNPAVYVGAFEHLRDLFAQTDLARQRGYNSSAFSFNSGVGQCERCRGAGFEKIEMQFLSDVFVRCPDCNGRRYRAHILEVKLRAGGRALSIADLLETPVDDALDFLDRFLHLPAGRRAGAALGLLRDVGLGYLRLGQPINTLSGGESQRLKLVSHLAASAALRERGEGTAAAAAAEHGRGTLFLLDEPTTGLHFDDVRQLVAVLQRLVEAGHSLLVIEHNLDVIRCADWVIDLGPEAGEGGGRIVVEGTPEEVAACETSHTGRALRSALLPEGNGAVRSARRTPRAENA